MGKLKIGSCPRCNKGEIFFDRDQYGWYECCLQCGYSRDLPDIVIPVPVKQPEVFNETVPVRRPGRSTRRKRTWKKDE